MAEENVNVLVNDFPEAKKFLDDLGKTKGHDYAGAVILAMIGKLKVTTAKNRDFTADVSSLVFVEFIDKTGLGERFKEILADADRCIQALLDAIPELNEAKGGDV